jgi:SPOR domain
MSEYMKVQKEAERERARCRDAGSPSRQPVERAGKPPRSSMKEPGSQLQRLLLESESQTVRVKAPTRDAWRRRRREHDRRGLRVMAGIVLVLGLALLLGSFLANWVGRGGQNASSVTADTDTSTIPVARTTPQSAITTGEPAVLFWVQVGAFANPGNAERLAERLRSEGFTVVALQQQGTQEPARRTFQIVRVGAYPTAGLAEHARAELARLGYVGFVVREP